MRLVQKNKVCFSLHLDSAICIIKSSSGEDMRIHRLTKSYLRLPAEMMTSDGRWYIYGWHRLNSVNNKIHADWSQQDA